MKTFIYSLGAIIILNAMLRVDYSSKVPKTSFNEFTEDIIDTNSIGQSEFDDLVDALIFIESTNNDSAIGPTNDIGALQITPIYVDQCNIIVKEDKYTLDDRYSREKSIEMFYVYQRHFNPELCIHKAIRLHNPSAGEWYYNKVISRLKDISCLS